MNEPNPPDPRRYPYGAKTVAGPTRDVASRGQRRRPSSLRGRPVFSMVVAAAIVLGLPPIAYTGVMGSTLGASTADTAHHVALDTQPALSAHGGGTGGHGQAGGAGAAGGA